MEPVYSINPPIVIFFELAADSIKISPAASLLMIPSKPPDVIVIDIFLIPY